jgi:hypothetical protein
MCLSVEMDSLYGGHRIDCYSIVVRRSDDWVWFELFNIETQHMQKGGTFQGLNTGSNPAVDHTKLARAGGSSSEAHLYWRRWIKPTGIIFFDPALRVDRPLFRRSLSSLSGRINAANVSSFDTVLRLNRCLIERSSSLLSPPDKHLRCLSVLISHLVRTARSFEADRN